MVVVMHGAAATAAGLHERSRAAATVGVHGAFMSAAEQLEAEVLAAYEATRRAPSGWYTRLADCAWALCKKKYFQNSIYLFILGSCFHAGATTYSELRGLEWMVFSDVLMAMVFAAESVVKIVAEGNRPWMYFHGNPYWKWNCFDFSSK